MATRIITSEQKAIIKENAPKMTCQQLAEKVDIPYSTLFRYCKRNNIAINSEKKIKDNETVAPKNPVRPQATYTNSGSPFGIASGAFLDDPDLYFTVG